MKTNTAEKSNHIDGANISGALIEKPNNEIQRKRFRPVLDSDKKQNVVGPVKDDFRVANPDSSSKEGKLGWTFAGQQNPVQKFQSNSSKFAIKDMEILSKTESKSNITPVTKSNDSAMTNQVFSDSLKPGNIKTEPPVMLDPQLNKFKESLLDTLKGFEQRNENSFRVKIDVEDLGRLNIKLNKGFDDINILIQTSSLKTKELIEKMLPQIQNSLHAQHAQVEVNVTYDESRDEHFNSDKFLNRDKGQFARKNSQQFDEFPKEEEQTNSQRHYSWSNYEVIA